MHQTPLLHSGTQRKHKEFSSDAPSNADLMSHQMQFFLENYGCGYVWAVHDLSSTTIASQNRSDHGGRKQARSHSAAEIAGFFASAAANKSLAASDF